jgi:hypothetical protein
MRDADGGLIGPWNYSFFGLRGNKEGIIALPTVDIANKVVDIGNRSGSPTSVIQGVKTWFSDISLIILDKILFK